MNGLKVREVAIKLNVSEKTIYKWLNKGILPAGRIGKTWIIDEHSIEKLLSSSYGTKVDVSEDRLGNKNLISTQKDDQASLEKFSKILKNSIDSGIESILGPRSSDPETVNIISDELKNSTGEIRLMGVGLREFFSDKGHAKILRMMSDTDKNVFVKAILVDPVGKFARARAILEDGVQFQNDERFRSSLLYSDSWRSLNVIVNLRKSVEQRKKFMFDAKFVDYWPSVYMVMTENYCFTESYHFGKPNNESESYSIDGLVPIIQVSNSSDYYSVLKHHFDYIWGGTNPFVPVKSLKEVAQSMEVSV